MMKFLLPRTNTQYRLLRPYRLEYGDTKTYSVEFPAGTIFKINKLLINRNQDTMMVTVAKSYNKDSPYMGNTIGFAINLETFETLEVEKL